MRKFKKGDRVRVTETLACDESLGLDVGMVGTVIAYMVDGVALVQFDGFDPAASQNTHYEGYAMFDHQLELVEDEKGEPGCTPPAAAPVYVLTNAELQVAIEKTNDMRKQTSCTETIKHLRDHMYGLLKIQMARAEKDAAA